MPRYSFLSPDSGCRRMFTFIMSAAHARKTLPSYGIDFIDKNNCATTTGFCSLFSLFK